MLHKAITKERRLEKTIIPTQNHCAYKLLIFFFITSIQYTFYLMIWVIYKLKYINNTQCNKLITYILLMWVTNAHYNYIITSTIIRCSLLSSVCILLAFVVLVSLSSTMYIQILLVRSRYTYYSKPIFIKYTYIYIYNIIIALVINLHKLNVYYNFTHIVYIFFFMHVQQRPYSVYVCAVGRTVNQKKTHGYY